VDTPPIFLNTTFDYISTSLAGTHKSPDGNTLPKSAQGTVWLPSEQCGLLPLGQFKVTAHYHSEDLGWAEITHPFHRFQGQRFRILKTRKVGSIDTLILAEHSRGTFAVPREWTDKAVPYPYPEPLIFDYESLLHLKAMLESIKKYLTISGDKVESDHVYKWSEREVNQSPPAKTESHPPQASAIARDPSGLSCGAVQALRQTRVQVREWTRPRPQVLPDGELSKEKAGDGLCPGGFPGESKRVYEELPEGKRDTGRALRDQSGAPAPQRKSVDAHFHEHGLPRKRDGSDLREHAGGRDSQGGAA